MSDEAQQPFDIEFDTSVRVVMEHVGGPMDGWAPASDSPNEQEAMYVQVSYAACNRGEIGRAFAGNPIHFAFLMRQAEAAGFRGGLKMPKYQIVERRTEGDTVFVKYQYQGDV
jgi:hypothetical protein